MLHGTSLDLSGDVRERGGHIATREMNECSKLLEEALQKGKICLEVGNRERVEKALTCLMLSRYWAVFMKTVCDCFTKVNHIKFNVQ